MFRVLPHELHDYWPFVKEGLGKIKQTAQDDWLPEDVYTSVRNDTAHLYFTQAHDGFVVVNLLSGYDGGGEMHVWCAYGEDVDLLQESKELDEVARELGCKRITFFSARKGWARNKIGYEEVHTLYRKRLEAV